MSIPEEFQSSLRYVPSKDTRTDAEILASLTQHTPITSEKNIWTYWHAGVSAMPVWTQRNIANWVRLHGSSWTVRVLDTVPGSANHALKWLSKDDLPECFVAGSMTGPYTGPHSADFLRGAALVTYGGVWMDVGCLLFRDLDRVCWDQLADDESPYTISTPIMYAQWMANHFVAARKGDVFIRKWHELFTHLWKGRTDFNGVVSSPLTTFIQDFDFNTATSASYKWDFKIDAVTLMGYIGQVVAWVRCTWLQEPNGGFDGVEYYAKKVLLFDALEEAWGAEKTIGFNGEDLFEVFTTRRDADPESEAYKRAYAVTWRLLTKSSLQKITHGKGITHATHCGVLLDREENVGKDCEEGTFGELLRFGSVHFEQVREGIKYCEPELPDEKVIIQKGLLEA